MLRSIWDELEDMNRRFDEAFTTPLYPTRRFFGFLPIPRPTVERPFAPIADVFENKGDLVVKLELPGIDPVKDVKVTLEEGELVIRGEKKQEQEVKEKTYYRFETLYGSFERHFPVPETITESAVHAEYKDGILAITVKGAVKALETRKETAKAIPIAVTKELPVPAKS
ncbi:MAG TPA: Hsp20/alpha crystallin family protein [Candidatus Limnocylindrales bacterium]|nr:Hsp20/alpha crystallin family protein [Candidatus Limnocylindrales bacterium]